MTTKHTHAVKVMSNDKTPGADTSSIRVVKKEGRAAGFVYGSFVYYSVRKGWKFVSCVPHRRGSRKFYATPDAAFPSWLKRSEVEYVRTVTVGRTDPMNMDVVENAKGELVRMEGPYSPLSSSDPSLKE